MGTDTESKLKRLLEEALTQCEQLRQENHDLRKKCGLIDSNQGILFPSLSANEPISQKFVESSSLSTDQKIVLFRSLFRGREDVYAFRWEGKTGKSGYSPACGNEWVAGICEKPRIKCSECPNQNYLSMTDQVLHGHLSGKKTIGIYPLLQDETGRQQCFHQYGRAAL